MTTAKITKVLSAIGANVDEVFQPTKIRTVIMDSNFSVDFRRDRFLFDTSDNLLKVKQYKYEKRSGILTSFVKLSEDKKTIQSTESGKYFYNSPEWPGRGKEILLIPKSNPATGTTKSYTIASNGRNFIEVENPINENLDNYFIIYLLEPKNELARDALNILEFYKFIPLTNNLYDIYLDTTAIIGFEGSSAVLGST